MSTPLLPSKISQASKLQCLNLKSCFYLQILIALQYVKWILYHCLQGAYKQMGQKIKLYTQVKNEKNAAKMPQKDK